MNYQVIESYGFDKDQIKSFVSRCDKEVASGWIPAGGPMTYYYNGVVVCVFQAMWKPLDKEERDGRHI